MSAQPVRPDTLWTQKSPTPSVDQYIDLHFGEFPTDFIESSYPYSGEATDSFRRCSAKDGRKGFDMFPGLGEGCWVPRRDAILNGLTADLLAAADLLQGSASASRASAMPCGIGMDSGRVWVTLLDGGVGVELHVSEHEYTNRLSGHQRTTIRGAMAYRVLLEFLGFDCPPRKLYCEPAPTSQSEVNATIDKLLAPARPDSR